MTRNEAATYLTALSDQYGIGQSGVGKRTVYGMLASKALSASGIRPGIRMGMWMQSLCDTLGIREGRRYGVVAVAQRVSKWLNPAR